MADKPAGGRVKYLYIAPASTKIKKGSHYILSSNDYVINLLRTLSGNVLPANVNAPPQVDDLTGHKLVETYYKSDLFPVNENSSSVSMRDLTRIEISKGLDSLPQAQCIYSYRYKGGLFNYKQSAQFFNSGHFEGEVGLKRDLEGFSGELGISDVDYFFMSVPELGKSITYDSKSPCNMSFYMKVLNGRISFWIIDARSDLINTCATPNTFMSMYGHAGATSDEYFDSRVNPLYGGVYLGPVEGWTPATP